MKRFALASGALLLVAVAAGLILLPRLARPKPVAPYDQATALKGADVKLKQLRADLATGQAALTLSQDEVRAVIAQSAALLPGELQGLDVKLEPGRLEVQVNLIAGGRPLSLTVGGSPSIQEGALLLKVDRVMVGSLPMPVGTALRLISSQAGGIGVDASTETLSLPLRDLTLGGQAVTLQDLTVGSGDLTLDLSAR